MYIYIYDICMYIYIYTYILLHRNVARIYHHLKICYQINTIVTWSHLSLGRYRLYNVWYGPRSIFGTVCSSKSPISEKCGTFFRFWCMSKWSFFLRGALKVSKPQLKFKKITMRWILLYKSIDFGCSVSTYIYIQNTVLRCIIKFFTQHSQSP